MTHIYLSNLMGTNAYCSIDGINVNVPCGKSELAVNSYLLTPLVYGGPPLSPLSVGFGVGCSNFSDCMIVIPMSGGGFVTDFIRYDQPFEAGMAHASLLWFVTISLYLFKFWGVKAVRATSVD